MGTVVVSMSFTLAIYQGSAEPSDKERNIAKMKELMTEAKGRRADILVLPELFTTGYHLSGDLMKQLAEERNGSTFITLSRHAKDIGIAVLYGYPEFGEDRKLYNSAQFIDSQGVSLANYRKTHLWITDSEKYEAVFTPGESIAMFDYLDFKMGILICYDVEFSEMVRHLGLRGVEVVLAPVAVAKMASSELTDYLIPGHAVGNRACIAYVNHCGGRFNGNSKVFSSDGSKLIDLGENDMSMATCEVVRNKRCANHLLDRRRELYRKLDLQNS